MTYIKPLITTPSVYKMWDLELIAYKKYILKYKKYILSRNDVDYEILKPYIEKCKREWYRVQRRMKVVHAYVLKVIEQSREFDKTYIPIK